MHLSYPVSYHTQPWKTNLAQTLIVARGVAGAGLGWGGGGGVEGWGQIAFRGKLTSSCSLAWKLGVMSMKSEWVIKSCPNALNIPFRIALWNLSRALRNLDSLENYNSRQFLLVIFLGVCRQNGPEEVSFSNTSSDLASNIHPRFKSRKGSQTRHGQKLCHHYSD